MRTGQMTGNGADTMRLVEAGACDGSHPETDKRCILGDHKGQHQAEDGSQWLDDE